jgi:hypothetical protein
MSGRGEGGGKADIPMSNMGLDIKPKRRGDGRYILPYQLLEDSSLASIIKSTLYISLAHSHLNCGRRGGLFQA